MLEEELISIKELNYLLVKEINTQTFHRIPKLHKSLSNPPRSAIKGPLERVGTFIDALIKELVCELPLCKILEMFS